MIKIQENGRVVLFRNPTRSLYAVSKVDDCLIKEGKRSDYLVSKVGVASVFVELKGTDVHHACEQLLTSVEHAAVVPLREERIGFLVVCRKYPKFDYFVMKAKQTASRKYGAGFHVITRAQEIDIECVCSIDGKL